MSAALRRPPETIASLAARAGFEVDWEDANGVAQRVPDSTLAALLECIGLPCATGAQLRQSAAQLNAEQSARRLPPLITAEAGRAIALPAAAVRAGGRYRIDLESGERIEGRFTAPKGEPPLLAPIDEPGYHAVTIGDERLTLAVAPRRCPAPADLLRTPDDNARALWGIAAQVYGLRRAGDGGIGDYTALATLAAQSARHGAHALAVSPTHAMFAADPNRYSPYAPSSRLWLNVAHIDPAARFGSAAARAALAAAGAERTWAELEAQPLIDWPRAWPVRRAVLRALFDQFDAHDRSSGSAHARAFDAFCVERGAALDDHARFETLHASFVDETGRPRHWRDWPVGLRDPRSADVAAFAAEHRRDIDFHRFLQWLAADALAGAQRAARDAGMAIGLVADLAVGCDGGGSHAWSLPADMLARVSVGAPPDLFNQAGQSWGLTTFSPRAMQADGFRAFIDMLRAALACAGGVRIDHILGLRRLWLVPEGEKAAHGAYLRCPFEDLLRLIALEAARHRAIVIGEDLGTVPPGLRDRLAAHGLYGIRVLWFERDGDAFAPARRWDPHAVATTTTHDLPTVAGWWRGSDIDWRSRIGQMPARDDGRDPAEIEHAQRAADRDALWHALQDAEVAPAGAPTPAPDAAPVDAALAFVAGGASPLVMCPLEDLLALPDQPNLPGSIDEHPNWRRRLPVDVDALYDNPDVGRRVRAVRDARRHCAAGAQRDDDDAPPLSPPTTP